MKRLFLLIAAGLFASAAPGPASADIFQWQYINPADPSQGKQPSITLCPGGAGVNDVPNNYLEFLNLTKAYLIGADLSNAWLNQLILTSADFSHANLTNTQFFGDDLTSANFTGAEVRGARFAIGPTFTAAQLYSTASYQNHDLTAINLQFNDLSGWNFAGQNLTNAYFTFTTLTSANFTAADTRGAQGLNPPPASTITTNLIRSDGHVAGLDLTAGQSLLVRNYHGNPLALPDPSPIPIRIDQSLAMDPTGTLRLMFDADTWDSGISFAPGIPVSLGGTLELSFAAGVDINAQIGRSFQIFDWTGVTPAGSFSLSSPYAWDVSRLYTSGQVTLVPEPGSLALVGVGGAAALLARRINQRRGKPKQILF